MWDRKLWVAENEGKKMRQRKFWPIHLIIMSVLVVSSGSITEGKELSPVLNIYNWEDYFAPTTLADFEKRYGVKANLEIFADEEEMLASLISDPAKHDVIVTSDDTIRELIQMRLLAEINLDNIPNLVNIDHEFRNPNYDPGHRHSLPYLWGTTGIVVNRTYLSDHRESWSVLWNSQYQGRIAMLNSPYEVAGAGLKYLGHSLNTVDISKLEMAGEKLFEQNSLLAGYLDPVVITDRLISNELWAAQIYSGEGIFATENNDALEYFIPKEGTSIWVDCLAIPRDAQHKYTAEIFINYLLDPEVSASIANYLWYANCNSAARPYTLPEILENPFLYPPKETQDMCEFWCPVGTLEEQSKAEQFINKTWSELQLRQSKKIGE